MKDDPRRQSTRVRLNIIVEFNDGVSMSGTFCRNISEKGFFLESVDHVEIGRLLHITFRLPNRNKALHLQGIVRWRQSESSDDGVSGIGIEFLNLTADQLDSLKRELDHFLKAG